MTKDGAAFDFDSTHLLRSLFALIPVPVAVVDGDGCVIMANSSFSETFRDIANMSELPQHEVEVDGRGIFDIYTLPLTDTGLRMVYAVDVANEVTLRRQVVHLEKMAAIGRLVTNVAHELKAPLSDIRDYAPLISGCEMDGTARRAFDLIFSQAARAGTVVHSLLSLAGKEAPQRVPCDLNAIVRNLSAARGYPGRAHRFEVTLELDSHLPKTIGDPAQIEQVVFSLLVNAEEAISPLQRGPGLIGLSTMVRAGRIQLHVADNGCSRDATRAFGASQEGVGLSMCSEIVKDHGGELYAWSSYGGGSTFTLDLPAIST